MIRPFQEMFPAFRSYRTCFGLGYCTPICARGDVLLRNSRQRLSSRFSCRVLVSLKRQALRFCIPNRPHTLSRCATLVLSVRSQAPLGPGPSTLL